MAGARPPKRLRGWQWEKAQHSPFQKDPMESATASNPLCSRLIELWSQGRLSASQVSEICYLAFLSGCDHPEILAIAKCGNFQQQAGNCHRDLVNLQCKSLKIADPHPVKTWVKDPKSQKAVQEELPVLLPHVQFSRLSQEYPEGFGTIFATSECQAFWQGVEKAKDPRLVKPIGSNGKVHAPAKTIPLFIHGDGCEFQTRDSLMTWSWGSLLCQNPSLTAVPKSCTLPETWGQLDTWIAWSFQALAKGMHPTTDPWGKPLTKGDLSQLAGQPLSNQGYRAVIWSIQGDNEFYANVLKLPHWQNQYPCHECDCQRPVYKKTRCPPKKSVKILKEEDQHFNDVSPAQAALDKRSSHPLFSIEGVSSALVRGDSLHILYSRGVASHLAGSLIHYLCYYDWPKRQAVPPTQRLAKIFSKIRELYSEKQVPNRMTNMRLSMLTDTTKPHKRPPCLEAKAAETKWLLPCLEALLAEVLDPEEDPIHSTMLECIGALNQLISHMDNIGAFPTASEYKVVDRLAKRFFDCYQDLHDWALAKGRKLFHIVHKFHSCRHLFKNTRYLNYRAHHNFKAEDFVGQISQLAHSCSFGVGSTRLPAKIMEKYKILVHLQLTKPGFGFVMEDDGC